MPISTLHLVLHLALLLVLTAGSIVPPAAALAVQAALVPQAPANQPPPGGDLFAPAPTGASRPAALPAGVLRAEAVSVRFERLAGLNAVPGQRLSLNLFPDTRLEALIEQVQANPNGSQTWSGSLDGQPHSTVTLVGQDGVLTGYIATLDATYEVRYRAGAAPGESWHEILQIDPRSREPAGEQDGATPDDSILVPDGSSPARPAASRPQAPNAQGASAADDGSVIDLLVVYTPAAATAAGGTTAVQNMIQVGVANFNRSNSNSGLAARIYLVGMLEVAYTDSGNSLTDLYRLRDHGDGFLDSVTQPGTGLRDTYHADLVTLVAGSGSWGVCGVGFLPQTAPAPTFSESAVNFVLLDCVQDLTLAHENGHNMGLRHDWFVDVAPTPTSYGRGYVSHPKDGTPRWRSVMAYGDLCSRDGGGSACARLPFWSTPAKSFGGIPGGVAAGTSTACQYYQQTPDPSSCDSDESAALNLVAPTVAGYRTGSTTWLGQSSDWNAAANWSKGHAPRGIDDVFIPAGVTAPVISADASVRSLALADGAKLTMTGGTLTVYGDWDEQGSAVFQASGGQVLFNGPFDQSLRTQPGSHFHHLHIDGGQSVSLLSDLDINGDFKLLGLAVLQAGSFILHVGGSWSEALNGFVAGTSTVILDGAAQQVVKAALPGVALNEKFTAADGQACCSAAYLPSGWLRQLPPVGYGWLAGDSWPGMGGTLIRHYTSSDAWLFSPRLTLRAGVTYQVAYSYRVSSSIGSTTGIENIRLYLGSLPLSTAMQPTPLSELIASGIDLQSHAQTFSVASDGTYYLGLRGAQVNEATNLWLDDLQISGLRPPAFYNLAVQSSLGAGLPVSGTQVLNDLSILPGGVLDLSGISLTVEGAVTNQGELRQALQVPAGATTPFLRLQSIAGEERFRGAELTPETGSGLGQTSLALWGAQACPGAPNTGLTVQHCAEIIPADQHPATLRLYYHPAALNGSDPAALKIFHYDGTQWQAQSGSYSYESDGGALDWVQVSGVSAFSPFLSSTRHPLAVELVDFSAGSGPGGIQLDWETKGYSQAVTVDLYRRDAPNGGYTKVNDAPLVPQLLLTGQARYRFVDAAVQPGRRYEYRLEFLAPGADSDLHGPLAATALQWVFMPVIMR